MKTKVCVVCSKEFSPHAPNSRCCSVTCIGKREVARRGRAGRERYAANREKQKTYNREYKEIHQRKRKFIAAMSALQCLDAGRADDLFQNDEQKAAARTDLEQACRQSLAMVMHAYPELEELPDGRWRHRDRNVGPTSEAVR